MSRKPTYLLLLALVAAFSCSQPRSVETFRLLSEKVEGEYIFDLDFSDTLCLYDLSFYTRLDSQGKVSSNGNSIPLTVKMISPSGEKFRETVYLDLTHSSDSSYFSRQYKIPYRKGLKPVEAGMWEMRVSMPRYFGEMTGLGLICTKR